MKNVMIKNWCKKLWMLCTFACFAWVAGAQIVIHVSVLPPYYTHFTDYSSHPQQIMLLVTNTSDKGKDIQLRGSITGDNGVEISVDKNFKNATPLHVDAGATRTLNGNDINSLFDFNQLVYTGISRDKLMLQGNLPEGNYQVCVRAYDYNTNVPLSEDQPTGCSNTFPVSSVEPPTIIKPSDGDALPAAGGQNFVITWSTPAGALPTTQYTVSIAEVLDNRSPQVAIMSATNPMFYQATVTGTNVLLYNAAMPALTQGRRYAMMVTAKDPTNRITFRNNGQSEVIGFVYGDVSLPPDNGNVAGGVVCSCTVPLPVNGQASTNISPGGVITAGNFSITVLSVFKNNNNTISGTGKVNLPVANSGYIPVGVAFNNIQINSSNQLISGVINAQVKSDVNFLPTVPGPNPSLMPFTQSDVTNLSDYIDRNVANTVSQLKNTAANTVFQLPIGLDKSLLGSPVTIEVTALTITPTQAVMDAATIINTPDDNVVSRIALGAKNLCVNPTDLCGDAKLFLAADVNLPSLNLTLKGAGSPDGGSYVVFDKNGFKSLQISADMALPQSLIVKLADKASPVTAHFNVNTTNGWSDWMAQVKIDPFAIAGNNDFGFIQVGDAVYDHSDIQNPAGLPTIAEKPELTTPQWHGFYLPQLAVNLPAVLKTAQGQPVTAAVQNLIIDGNGVSGNLAATNLLQIGDGSLGGWFYSIDDVGLNIINNGFKTGGLNGRVVLPISGSDYKNSTNQLNYHCALAYNNGLQFQFAINTAGGKNINIPMWIASLNISNTSNITVTAGGGSDFVAQATLNGDLSIDTKVDPFGHINFKLLEVEGLQITNQAPYIQVKNFTAGVASPNKTLANLPVTLDPPSLVATPGGLGIKLGMGIQLGDGNMPAPSAGFSMVIAGKINFSNGRPDWTFDKITPDKIKVASGPLGPVNISGELEFINDSKFGSAIQGTLKAAFIDAFTCDAHVLFGQTDGPNGYPYFYVDAAAVFQPGIVLCTLPGPPISVFGFGGGLYFNLARRQDLTPKEAVDASAPPSGKYNPSVGTAGFKAKILIGTNDGFTFLGSGGVEVGLNINRFAFDYLDIDLAAYYLCSSTDWNPIAAITGTSTLQFDFAHNSFNGGVNVDINYPPGPAAYLKGSIVGDFHFGNNSPWHVALGTPSKRASIQYVVPGLETSLEKIDGYFWMGDDGTGQIPPPEAPTDKLRAQLASLAGSTNGGDAARVSSGPASGVPGIAFGAALQFGDQVSFGPVYAVLTLGGGFDLNLSKFSEPCDGVPGHAPPGLDGWYAQGQLYFYFEGGGGVKCSIFGHDITAPLVDISAVALARGGLPNPFYFSAGVNVSIDAAFGLISGSYGIQVNVGAKCTNNAYSSPISIPIISDLQPIGGTPGNAGNPSIWTHPEVAFNFPVNKVIELNVIENDGSLKPHSFRINLDKFEVRYTSNNAPFRDLTNSSPNFASDYMSAFLYDPSRDRAFDPNTGYTINVHVSLSEVDKVSGSVIQTFGGGETRTATFTSGPCVLSTSAILATFPLKNQRYFLSGDYHNGTVYFSEGLPDCLKDADSKYTLYAEFVPFQNGSALTPIDQPVSYASDPARYTFAIPDLPTGALIKLRIVKKLNAFGIRANLAVFQSGFGTKLNFSTVSGPVNIRYNNNQITGNVTTLPAEVEVMSYYFKTSQYKTLNAKVAAMNKAATAAASNLGTKTLAYNATFDAYEKFDTYDANGFIQYTGGYEFWIAPLVMLVEDPKGHNPWYTDYVTQQVYYPMYGLSGYVGENYVPNPYRTPLQLQEVGNNVPVGPINFIASSVDGPLTQSEINQMDGLLFRAKFQNAVMQVPF